MGDMADFSMEAWDPVIDGYGGHYPEYEPSPPARKTCRHCGEDNLYWMLHEGKWRLGKRVEKRARVVIDPPHLANFRVDRTDTWSAMEVHDCPKVSLNGSVNKSITCKHCNEENLVWMNVDGKWRLGDGEEVHVCEEYERKRK